uniref:Uncharacterized protein n=1 Tax=Anguilla anguilla TaxID=7936 RepID=A0A0E9UCK4_ANGAN
MLQCYWTYGPLCACILTRIRFPFYAQEACHVFSNKRGKLKTLWLLHGKWCFNMFSFTLCQFNVRL